MHRHPPVDRHVWQKNLKKVSQPSDRFASAAAGMVWLVRHPYAMVGAIWLLSVGIGSMAAISIFKVDPNIPAITAQSERPLERPLDRSPAEAISPQAETSKQPEETPIDSDIDSDIPNPRIESVKQSEETLPLFSLGAVALGCAVGCLMLSRRFRSSPPEQQARLPARSRLPRHNVSEISPTIRKTPIKAASRSTALPTAKVTAPASKSNSAAGVTPVSIAVVPANEIHPLDWDEPSLADNLDIRQKSPLSRWL